MPRRHEASGDVCCGGLCKSLGCIDQAVASALVSRASGSALLVVTGFAGGSDAQILKSSKHAFEQRLRALFTEF